ncbi:MAG: hypothetical protein ACK6DY_11310 [Acidobacteriota bacterium]
MKVKLTTTSGDWEEVVLTRDGNTYVGGIGITMVGAARRSGALSVARGDAVTVYYSDADSGAGFRQVGRTVQVAGAMHRRQRRQRPTRFRTSGA